MSEDPVRQATRVPPNRASKVYSRSFSAALVTYLALLEWFFRAATGHGALAIVPAWFGRGSGVAVLGLVWLFATLAFALLVASTVRNAFVALTGRLDAYIFLGDQLRDGFHAVLERQRPWNASFVPRFISLPWSPSITFHAAYKRLWLLEDAEGNITPVETLRTWRTVLSMLLQGLALAASALPCVVVAGMFNLGFPQKLQVPDAWAALNLRGDALPLAIGAWALANGAALLVIRRRMGGASGVEQALPLPVSVVRSGAVLPGSVVGMERYTTSRASRSRDNWHHQRYAVRFEGPDFPLPIFVHWEARRIRDADMTDASARLRKEMQRERDHNEAAFDALDAALETGTPIDFQVTEDLAIAPRIAGLAPFEPDTDDD